MKRSLRPWRGARSFCPTKYSVIQIPSSATMAVVAAPSSKISAQKGQRKTPKLLPLEGLMNYAAQVLTVRAQSTGELREKLKRRAEQTDDVDEVIRRLKDVGYLNDQRFAESFAGWR